jgi:hypothetical protein
MLLEENQDFEQFLGFHDKAVAVLKKAGFKWMTAVVLRRCCDVLFDILNRAPGKPHALVIDTKLAFIPGAAAGGAD